MNPIKIEPAIRQLELMLGPECFQRRRVPSDGMVTLKSTDEKPEFVVETYTIDPNGRMSVSRSSEELT